MNDTMPGDADTLADRITDALAVSAREQQPARIDVGTLIQTRDLLRQVADNRGMVNPTPPRSTPPPLLGGPAHYRRAVELLEQAEYPVRWVTGTDGEQVAEWWKGGPWIITPPVEPPDVTPLLLAAQVHATLADVALRAEADPTIRVGRSSPGDPEMNEPATWGTPWGRAIYGDQ